MYASDCIHFHTDSAGGKISQKLLQQNKINNIMITLLLIHKKIYNYVIINVTVLDKKSKNTLIDYLKLFLTFYSVCV